MMQQAPALLSIALLALLLLCTLVHSSKNSLRSSTSSSATPSLAGVILTTGKDSRVFEKSIGSALRHLLDVQTFFVVTPSPAELRLKYQTVLGERVVFVDERVFPFNASHVDEIMIGAVKEKGVYPLSGRSAFERTVWGKLGWFLQQLLKLYAGKVLKLKDFVLLDSDVMWFRDVRFINGTFSNAVTGKSYTRYNYASSGQYHGPYFASLKRIGGVDMYDFTGGVFRSGIVHHIVIVQHVLQQLMEESENLHGNIPFWQVLLNESALEMTCRAPKEGICGAGSTLSEYELYFNYARQKFPETMNFRPLLWANGPMPGLLFWPENYEEGKFQADKNKNNWLNHRQNEVLEAFEKQIEADRMQGYDYVGYHAYAKRRYYEMVQPDYDALCTNVVAFNTTCSWKGFDDRHDKTVTQQSWFQGCACQMIRT